MAGIQASIMGTAPADYAGDVSVDETWRVLQADEKSLLIDVRTKAEWAFVGLPDMSTTANELACVEWQTYPTMELNSNFVDEVKQLAAKKGLPDDANLFVVCRSGARSKSASIALTKLGFKSVHNVAGGFEGDLDSDHHRGDTNGWKATGLPWRQS